DVPAVPRDLHSFPTRRSSDLVAPGQGLHLCQDVTAVLVVLAGALAAACGGHLRDLQAGLLEDVGDVAVELITEAGGQDRLAGLRSEEHTSELQSRENLVCRLL